MFSCHADPITLLEMLYYWVFYFMLERKEKAKKKDEGKEQRGRHLLRTHS